MLSLAQTRNGYLWVGTQQGLTRFNGVEFRVLREPEARHLESGKITALLATRDGSLFIGCEGFGVTRWKGGAFTHYGTNNGLPNADIHCFVEKPDGAVWVGTEGGLVLLRDVPVNTTTVRDGLGDNSVRALALDLSGNLYVATKRGLTTIGADGSIRTRIFPGRWNANALRAVWARDSSSVWVGATDGLYHITPTNQTAFNIREGLPDPIINAIWGDHSGAVWIGTYGGLARIRDGMIRLLPGLSPMAEDMINVILEDTEHNIWVGTRDGLMRLSPSRFATLTTQTGLSGNNIMSVLEDRTGRICLGVWGGGLNVISNGSVRVYPHPSEVARDSVLSLLETRDGSLWAGMDFELGLNVLSNDTRIALSGLVTNGPIRALYEDRHGAMWVGGDGGLMVVSAAATNIYTTFNGLPGNVVRVITGDRHGNVWVGTDRGLSCFGGGTIRRWGKSDGLSHEMINALYFDEEDRLWIGTLGGGLNCGKDGRFVFWTTRDGLFSDDVYEILEDDQGYFWMSCRKGLFRVARRDLFKQKDGGLERISSTVFSRADGLVSVQFNGVAKPAAWKDRSGRLWFASIGGVAQVDPSIPTNMRRPPVVIERIAAGTQVLWATDDGASADKITVPAGAQDVEIYYAALSLTSPEKNKFSYRLEGADSKWTYAGSERLARYNKLAPGRYRFCVIACNNDGVWNEDGAAVAVTVLPKFWQTWWFRAFAAVAVASLVWLAFSIRLSRLRALEDLRMSIAANLHDDVGARLTKVAMITEHVNHQVGSEHRIKPGIDAIARATADVTRAMDEVVWTINPKNDTVENLANYVFHYAQEYFQNTNVRCLLDFPTELPARSIPTAMRHNLFMTLKEALNNVLKHSKASEVRIQLHTRERGLVIDIVDDGSGFDVERARGAGDGLKNMRQRVEQFGGQVGWFTAPGKGTRVTIEMPWA